MRKARWELVHLLESPCLKSMAHRLEQHLRRGDLTELRGILWELRRWSRSQRVDDENEHLRRGDPTELSGTVWEL